VFLRLKPEELGDVGERRHRTEVGSPQLEVGVEQSIGERDPLIPHSYFLLAFRRFGTVKNKMTPAT
jgi:hypothetical protein